MAEFDLDGTKRRAETGDKDAIFTMISFYKHCFDVLIEQGQTNDAREAFGLFDYWVEKSKSLGYTK